MKKYLPLLVSCFIFQFSSAQADLCTGAINLGVTANCSSPVAYTIPTSFTENFSSDPSCGLSHVEGFYTFTATSSGTHISLTDGANPAGANNPNPGIAVFTGTCGGVLTQIACSGNPNGQAENLAIVTTIGQVYIVSVFSTNTAGTNEANIATTGTICISQAPTGAMCQSAEVLTIGTTDCGTNNFIGNFNSNSTPPYNSCSLNFNDGEYWYKIIGTGQSLNIAMTGLSGSFSGVFMFNGCPNTTNCLTYNSTTGSSNYDFNTPVLASGLEYFVCVAQFGLPNAINFCLTTTLNSSTIVSASDCPNYVNICSDIGFQIDPNNFGTMDEIPAPGSISNPDYDGATMTPWGTFNEGCLGVGESNSTWMVINISGSGDLEFTFGGLGAQIGFYDWIMYPYNGLSTCQAIVNNTIPPVRCNWNGIDEGGTGIASVLPVLGDPTNFEPELPVLAGERYIICFSNYSGTTTTVPLEFAGTATVSCTPLGLKMSPVGLDVDCDLDIVSLNWTVSVGIENLNYELERSSNGIDWEIANLLDDSKVVSSEIVNYRISSMLKGTGFNYFRIKEIDQNGNAEYSAIKTAKCGEVNGMYQCTPNPAYGFTNMWYKSNDENGLISVFDTSGKLIFEENLPNTHLKITSATFDINAFEEGIYFVQTKTDGKIHFSKLIVAGN